MPGTAMQLINVPMHSLKLALRFSDPRISPSHSAPCTVEWVVVKSYSHSMWQSHCSGRSPSALQNGASQEDMTYSSGRVGERERQTHISLVIEEKKGSRLSLKCRI